MELSVFRAQKLCEVLGRVSSQRPRYIACRLSNDTQYFLQYLYHTIWQSKRTQPSIAGNQESLKTKTSETFYIELVLNLCREKY